MVNFVVSQEKGIEVSAVDLITFLNQSSKFELSDLGAIAVLAELVSSGASALPEPQASIIKTAFTKAGVKL